MGHSLAALLAVAIGAGDPEGNYIVPGTRGAIVYRRVDGQELKLDAYAQRRGPRRPGVVVIHGGGWTSGSRVAFVGQLLETLTRAGYNWVSIEYRLGGRDRHAEALDDVRAALAFVRENAADLRIDPGRIALLGEDAGPAGPTPSSCTAGGTPTRPPRGRAASARASPPAARAARCTS